MATQTANKTAAKPAPAKAATAAPKAEAKPAFALDFTGLEVADVKADEVKHQRNSQLDKTPVPAWLKESYENDQAKAVTVPSEEAAEALHTLLRSAAARMEIGVKVVITNGEAEGSKVVKFLGKDKRDYKPRKATAAK